ncbi:stearoyl-CoA 9-desaturase [Kouleothrix aurantiaca]|uniref:Stearoyl-CoA 9-desaturase n=1 Tax=Kouleothrix aurantiaca TaxID=186479 RepID=A0A0P9F547_9CHLR|nr:stearoyl-CoA 9-desaturase [Kouleothrix aurantiaca]
METTEQELEKSLAEKILVFIGVVAPLIATLYAITRLWQRYVTWSDIVLMLVFYVISGLGITIGFHRMLTHKSFETSKFVKALFLIMGCMAWEGNPITWASTHIKHHAHSDQEDDPHSPLVSLWHAHVGWIFTEVADPETYGSWLRKDPVIVWVDKTWWMWGLLGMLIPFAIGGWSGLLWGGAVRMFITHHITWSVNSVCHTFGKRPFRTKDASRNNWLVGLLAFGEGWHNNHHAFPRSAFHGMEWWQFDLSSIIIRTLESAKIVWNVHRIKPDDKQKRSAGMALQADALES